MADGLFPTLPKDITKTSDEELATLLKESEAAAELIKDEDAEFLAGRSAEDVLAQLREGIDQIKMLRGEVAERDASAERYASEKESMFAEISAEAAEEDSGDDNGDDEEEAEAAAEENGDEPEAFEEEAEVADPVREKVLVADAAPEPTPEPEPAPRLRRVPTPAPDRVVVAEPEKKLSFVASGMVPAAPPGTVFDTADELAGAMEKVARGLSPVAHVAGGREDKYLVASLDYKDNFPDERQLRRGDITGNGDKVRAVFDMFSGSSEAATSLTASGGLCAPLEPIYTMPQLASAARPVRDALPNFRAERGGVNVPTPTTISDAAGAITVITEAEDGLGGTFATKACLDMSCPDYSEYAVTVISHCREFGNLNAMAWPEKIRHENELTMAQHSRVAEGYILGQIKSLSLKVSSGAETLGAIVYLMDAITKSQFGIRSRLRLPNEARFVALLPRVALDILLLDTIQTSFDSYRTRGDIEAYLNSVGVDVTWYMDTPLLGNGVGTDGPSMIADAAQADQAALEAFPDVIQWALFPAGTFLHIDMAELNLGIVRDSTLNSTNDFQIFGETFENVARIGPAQAAYWETTDICANGMRAPAGTARTCD